MRGYETRVVLEEGEFSIDAENGGIRAAVFQDDARRQAEIATPYRRINEMESVLAEKVFDAFLPKKPSSGQLETCNLLDVSEKDGRYVFQRKRKAITAKENGCGRFAVLTTSGLPWKDLPIEYRQRNDVECGFLQLRSGLFTGIKGKSDRKSAEGRTSGELPVPQIQTGPPEQDEVIRHHGRDVDSQTDEGPEETEDDPGGGRVAPQRGDQETEGTDGGTGSPAHMASISTRRISEGQPNPEELF